MTETRQRLLDAAWDVVCDDGLRGATSRRITAHAGANLGAITYHFGSKDALLAEAAVARMQAWMEPLARALLEDESDGGDRTSAVIASFFDVFRAGDPETRALLEVLVGGAGLSGVRDTVRAELAAFQKVVADLMRRQQERGEIPASVRPDAMSGLFTAFALGLMVQDVVGAMPAPAPEVAGQLLALLATD